MIAFVVWALLVIGFTYTVTCSTIFAVPRILAARLGEFFKVLMYCSYCVSFWAGVSLFPLSPITFRFWEVTAALSGFAALGLVALLKGIFNGLLRSEDAFMQEQMTLTVESNDDPPTEEKKNV